MTDELQTIIKETVEQAVDVKINGKLMAIKAQLNDQDKILVEMKGLLDDKKFLEQLWAFVKFLCGIIMAAGTAYFLYEKIK